MKKTLALTILLAALPLVLLLPGAPRSLGGPQAYRHFVLWGVPAAAALLAALFSLQGPRGILFPGAPQTMRRLLPWCIAALGVDFSFLGAGHLLGWVTFTYGDQGYSGHPARTVLWALPLCLLVGVFGWEWALRRTLFVSWTGRVGRAPALLISCVVGVALAAPAILPGLLVPDPSYAAAAFAVAACREISFALIFASGAGLPAAGIYRGLFAYLDAFVINDWYSVHFPAANYTTSEPAFYLLRGAAAILSAALVAAGARLAPRGRAAVSAQQKPWWVTCAVFGLVVMATWTLVIKYLAPLLYFVSERAAGRAPAGVPVMWDFWWVAHLALAWLLWHRHRRARAAGIALSAIEIVIVASKFAVYLRRPDLSFWRLLWFTNKVYVLAFFIVLLVVLVRRKRWPEPTGEKTGAPS